jgi:hypothetical protein
MAPRRKETEISVERAFGPGGPNDGVVRLTAHFAASENGEPPTPRELAEALEALRADLDALVGPPIAAVPVARTDRELSELVGTYRPRQRQLVDALRDDGEISLPEHARLVEYLARTFPNSTSAPPPTAPPPAAPEPSFDQPIAAVPIAAERVSDRSRPVAELVRVYEIASLKQAGAVRARRQISFEEYMALKRHFLDSESAEAPTNG